MHERPSLPVRAAAVGSRVRGDHPNTSKSSDCGSDNVQSTLVKWHHLFELSFEEPSGASA
jgi:hypothetical protein